MLPSVAKWRNSSNRAIINSKLRHIIPTANDLLASIHSAKDGITLTELLVQHPNLARRTAQRHIAKLVEDGQIVAQGEPRARRYFGEQSQVNVKHKTHDAFASTIPMSAESQDILTYINQSLITRKPVGYQPHLLNAYRPNKTAYLYVWAYERSAQEYLAIKQDLAEPDPLRLVWRDFIKNTIHTVVIQPEEDPFTIIQTAVNKQVDAPERSELQALIIDELRRLHEGVLARYGLRPSKFNAWRATHKT